MFRPKDDIAYRVQSQTSDTESQREQKSRFWHQSSNPRVDRSYTSVAECQRILQEGHPTFVPTFSRLRDTCMQRTVEKLQSLDRQIEAIADHSSPQRTDLIDQACDLLQVLDHQYDATVARHQLEDPHYAAQHGMSVIHFTHNEGPKQGDWTMLASNWGEKSTSITEHWDPTSTKKSEVKKVSSLHQGFLRNFANRNPDIVAFKRPKTTLERQPRAVRYENEVVVPNPLWKMLWAALLVFACFCLFMFFAVGVIATTTTFSPTFVTTFFWIAIIWTMVSSSLLCALVRAFGASARDCVGAFLACVAIWLVVIQIGQTHLAAQDPTGSGIALSYHGGNSTNTTIGF